MERLEFDLSLIARRKFTLATPYNPVQQDTHHNPRDRESRTKKRCFTRNRIAPHSNHQASSPQGMDENINLTSCDLSDAERSLLTKGLAFCLTLKMLTGRKLLTDEFVFLYSITAEIQMTIITQLMNAFQQFPPQAIGCLLSRAFPRLNFS